MRRRFVSVAALLIGLIGCFLVVTAAPAAAVFTENQIGCQGSAVITADDGKTTSVDAKDASVKLPGSGAAKWSGAITTTTHNHSGEVKLKLAVFDIGLGSWGPSKNAGNASTASGTKKIPSALKQVPVGKYVLSGFHRGDEGGCAGHMTVELDGSPTSNAAGIVSLAGTVLTGALMALAAMARAAKGAVR
ncbi:MAG: hypothetical protein QOI20_2097 [Acidimicrobiaceae bacterium]|jgi:hypothetical protein|nr:hypothetical protein [Acidimicrobiaceae bacterium]